MASHRLLWIVVVLTLLDAGSALGGTDLCGSHGLVFDPETDFHEVSGEDVHISDLVGDRTVAIPLTLDGMLTKLVLNGREETLGLTGPFFDMQMGKKSHMKLDLLAISMGLNADGWAGSEEERHYFSIEAGLGDHGKKIRLEMDYDPDEILGGAARRMIGGIPLEPHNNVLYVIDEGTDEVVKKVEFETSGSKGAWTISPNVQDLLGATASDVTSELALSAAQFELVQGREETGRAILRRHSDRNGLGGQHADHLAQLLLGGAGASEPDEQGIDLSIARLVDGIARNHTGISGIELAEQRAISFLADTGTRPGEHALDPDELFWAALDLVSRAESMERVYFSIAPDYDPRDYVSAVSATMRTRASAGRTGPYRIQSLDVYDRPEYIGADFAGTALGEIAFKSDLALKSLYLGVDYHTGESVFLDETHERLVKERVLSSKLGYQDRIWFVPSEVLFRRDGDVTTVEVVVSARIMRIGDDGAGNLVDIGESKPQSQALADYITRNYDRACETYPVLHDLRAVYVNLFTLELARREGLDLGTMMSGPVGRDYYNPERIPAFVVGYVYRKSASSGYVTGTFGGVAILNAEETRETLREEPLDSSRFSPVSTFRVP